MQISRNKSLLLQFISIFSYGLAHIGRVGSVVLTLSISIERYCSVCHSTCTFKAKSLLLPLPIAFALIYNVPKFFELKSETVYEEICDKNFTNNQENETITHKNMSIHDELSLSTQYDVTEASTIGDQVTMSYHKEMNSVANCVNESTTYIDVTDLRRNPYYIIIYLFWSKFLCVEIVPYVLMIVMNILIWRKIQEFARIRRTALGINDGKLYGILKCIDRHRSIIISFLYIRFR